MNMLGQRGGHVRPPLLPIDDPEQLEMLRQILDEAGLFTDEMRPASAAGLVDDRILPRVI
jgi:hypothetical protein